MRGGLSRDVSPEVRPGALFGSCDQNLPTELEGLLAPKMAKMTGGPEYVGEASAVS